LKDIPKYYFGKSIPDYFKENIEILPETIEVKAKV